MNYISISLICDCQTKPKIAEWVCDVRKTLLMWLWLVRILSPISFFNTFVGNVFLGQCLEIIISLFKGWNFTFYFWSLMFGMYLKQFWSVSSFEISSWTFLCDYFFLCVPGTLINKSCLHKHHIMISFHFVVIFIANHHDTIEGSIRIIF